MGPDSSSKTVVGLGEALFDVFPDRRVVGGAPLNVAVHAQQCGRLLGTSIRGVVASRVGRDVAGDELIDIINRFGVDSDHVQRDPSLPTGRVLVTLDVKGSPSYEIEHPSAWDAFEIDTRWSALACTCDAVCFGTLAQRDSRSRHAIQRFLRAAPNAIRLLDVNLRQHFHDAEVLRASLELATMVKTNDHEAPIISAYAGLAALKSDHAHDAMRWSESFMDRFGLDAVVLTRGHRGTLICTREGAFESDGAGVETMNRFPPDPHADSVGAGDACAAGLLVGWLAGRRGVELVRLADRMGAYVAGRPGATPELPSNLCA